MNLIVGGTGFIGGHLAEYFFKEGEISKGVFRKGSHLRIMDQCGVQCLEADLMNRSTLHEPLDMVDVVYNLASPPPSASEEELTSFVNAGLNNLLEEANEHGVKTFVQLSCLDVYGSDGLIDSEMVPRPKDRYQRAKLSAENTVTEFARKNPDMKIRVVRAARPIGPRDTTLTVPILKMLERGRIVLPAEGSSQISLSHPKDIAQSLLRAATYAVDGGVTLVKSFDASLDDFSRAMMSVTAKRAELKQTGLFSGKTLLPQYTVEQVRARRTLNEQNAWSKISYVPSYTLQKTAEEVAEWHRKEPWVTKGPE